MIHPVSESNAKPLAIMSRWSVPSSEGKRAQIEPGELLRIALRNEEKGDRLDVEIVANLLEKSNEAIVWGANKVCGLHPEIGNACSQGKQLAMKGARIVEEHMPDVVKVTAGKLSQMRKEAIQISALHDQQKLGIPEDETLKFHDNLATIGLGALNFVGGTAVGRAIAPIVKSGIAATQLVMPRIPNAHIKKIVKPTPKTPIHLQESLADRLLRSGEESLLQRIPSVHFSEQTFKELAQKANPRIATEHITFYKKGKNFVVRVGKGEHSIVIKAADTYEAFFEAFGSQFFNTLKLKNLRFTPPINVIKDKGRVILVKPYASGKTIESWIHRYIQKKIPLEEVTEAIGQLGKAYDELQRVSIRYGILPSKHQKRFVFHPDFLLEILNDANSALREFRQPRIALTATQISAFSGQWQQSEVLAGFGLGDVGLTNFVYSKTNKNLVYVDGQSLANGINHIGHPLGIIEQDISVLVSDILDVSISNGMSAEQAHCLLDHFLNQLHKPMHPLPLLAGKIDAVERILQGIPLGKSPDLKEVEKFVERINEYIQIMQW
jgi:hypothetical protein